MKKNIRKIVIFMITAILLLPALPVVTQAARKTVISLKPGKTYKSYDFTGDAKKDKFKYVTYRGSDSSLYARVYINGKYKNAINLAQGGDLSLCRVSKKNVFLVASCGSFGGSHSICYVYKNGKFRDVTPAARSMLDYNWPVKASGGMLYFQSTSGKHAWLFANYSAPSCYLKYKASNKKLKLVSRYASASGTYKATRSFYTSNKATSMNSRGVMVRYGDLVKVQSIYLNSYGSAMVKLSVNGKTGWIPDYGHGYKNVDLKGALTPVSSYSNTGSSSKPTFQVSCGAAGSKTLTMNVSCSTGGVITWKSSDPSVATVDNNGVITAKSAGPATITASVKYNGNTYSVSKMIYIGSKKQYGAWSSWSLTPAYNSASQQFRTTTLYRYYCFLCPVCGGREPLQGTSDCHRYTLTLNNGVVAWFTTPYSAANSAPYSYAPYKRYTTSLGDGKKWNFSLGNINDHAVGTKDTDSDAVVITTGYSTRSITTTYYISSIS